MAPQRRVKQLRRQMGNPSLKLLWTGFYHDVSSKEAQLHSVYGRRRHRGEWFALDAQQVNDIIQLKTEKKDVVIPDIAGQRRSIYVKDKLWRPLKAKLVLEGISVSAWFREQAEQHVGNGHNKGQVSSEEEPGPFFVGEQEQ